MDDLAQVGSTGRVREGINFVDATGTVHVAAGTFVEDVTVSKAVVLRGAQAGNAVGGRTFGDPSESKLDGQLTIEAAGVRVNGFSITHDLPGDNTVFGVVVKAAGDDAVITNNIFHKIKAGTSGGGGAQAIYLDGGPDDVQIEDNLIDKVSSDRSAKGILVGDSDDGNPNMNVLIQGNTIKDVSSTSKGAYGVLVGNKEGASDFRVIDNDISNLDSGSGWVHAIGLERGTPNALVRRNVISGLSAPGADKVAVFFEDNPSYSSSVVTRNSLDVGGAAAGIAVHPSLVGSLDLDGTCNWWGAASGPGPVGPGSGSNVTTGVEFLPWLKSGDLSGDCDGGWPEARLTPAGHDYGSQTRGTPSAPFTFTLENVGQADLPVLYAGIGGANPNSFAIDTNGCDTVTLAPGASCVIKVVFQPNAVGGRTARLEVATDDPHGGLATADLSGEGTAPVPEAAVLTPGGHDFGNRDTGTSSDAFVFTLTNTGGSLLTSISVEIVGPDALQFTLSSGGTCTSTLPAGTSCSINVRHVPTAAGSHVATLRVTSSDPGGPDASGLAGSATTPGTGTITILQDTVPNSRQDFSFRDGLGDFVLDDDDTGTLPRGRTFTGLAPGPYTVEQIQVPGWSLTAVTCDNGARTDLWWHTAGIDLEAGKHVRCTFTSTRRLADGLISVTSKKRGFAGNDIRRSTVVPAQTRRITAGTGARTYTFWVKAQNDSKASDRLRIAASSVLTGGATVTFRVGNGDRTAAITGGTFVTNPRRPGAHSLVQVRVTIPAGTTPAGATVTFTISSDSQPTVIDVVQGIVAR